MAFTEAEIQKNLHRLAPFSIQRIELLNEIERKAISSFKGQIDELEAALGMLHLGDHFGWKPLVLIHNKRTIRKYEEILSIDIRELFEPEGPSVERSLGYKIAKKIGNFWKAVSGEVKSEELKAKRREVF